jgi:hypothetical protein
LFGVDGKTRSLEEQNKVIERYRALLLEKDRRRDAFLKRHAGVGLIGKMGGDDGGVGSLGGGGREDLRLREVPT